MATKGDLIDWLIHAIQKAGGSATILYVAQHIWKNHEKDLGRSGDLFST